MEDSDKESKTENPTEKRLGEAREEGNVPSSKEIPAASAIFALSFYFTVYGEKVFVEQSSMMRSLVESHIGHDQLQKTSLISIVEGLLLSTVKLWWPLFLILATVGFLASAAQNMPRLVAKRITPQFSRISPVSGWKRIFSSNNLAEFSKSVAKLAATILVFTITLSAALQSVVAIMFQSPSAMALTLSLLMGKVIFSLAVVAACVAALDLAWQRYHWWTGLKMTKQQIKDEFKQTEGDPVIKGRLRSLGRDRARNRMMKAVPTATLIIANPTHFAVALRYNQDVDPAPMVVATGTDLIALKIREIAEQNQVPVFEKVELARALHKSVSVGQIIPPQFYQALAEIIRIIYDSQEHRHAAKRI